MRITDCLLLLSSLQPSSKLYLLDLEHPLSKITITKDGVNFITGEKAMTKEKLVAILSKNKHKQLVIRYTDQLLFGLQIKDGAIIFV
ncbi:MAG: hypothetical protein Q3960_00410 [Lactobacillus sp.]|nr:hypothetical protein [Lactobacillus sp.]